MSARKCGVHDMSAIQLATGEQVERSGEHADPSGEGDGVEVYIRQWVGKSRRCVRQDCAAEFEDDGKSQWYVAGPSATPECETSRPISMAGTAKINPAIGPAMPISKSAERDGIYERMRMKAPSVPMRVGAGIKNGSVAETP